MENGIKIVVFDFDGTLAKTQENLQALVIETLKTLNYPDIVNEDNIELFRQKGARVALRTLGVRKIDLIRVARIVRKNQNELLKGVEVVEGMRETLTVLKEKGFKLGVLTSNSKSNVQWFLNEKKLEGFDFVKSSLNIFGKHRALKKILRSEGILSSEMIYVGDEIRDVEACKKVGVPVVAVTWGFNSRESLKKAGPDYVTDKPEELQEIVDMVDNGLWKKENST